MYQIIGIQRLDYYSKRGKHVSGYRVHFTFDLPAEGEDDGKAADSVYLPDSLFIQSGVRVGDKAIPVYNKYGRCQGFMEDVTGG